MGFADDIQAFADKAIKAASDNTNKVTEDLFTLVVNFSPSPSAHNASYATGLLANQWYPSQGEPSSDLSSSTSSDGSDSIARIQALSTANYFLGKDNTICLTNNTEEAYYADVLGWAKGIGTNGWHWTGEVGPYLMRQQAITYIQQAFT